MESENMPGGAAITPRDLLITALLVMAVATIGGYLAGMAIDHFGMIGAVALWLLGWISGRIASMSIQPRMLVGMLLASALIAAATFAETYWIRWNIVDVESWHDAIKRLPAFFDTFRVPALVAAIFTFFGCSAAYRQAGVDYVYVKIAR